MQDTISRSTLDQPKKDGSEKRESLKPVVSAPTKDKKKSVWEKIREEFISEDGKSVGDYILLDVLVPGMKSMIQAVVNNSIDMILYGGSGPRGNSGNNYNGSYRQNNVSYRPYYDQRNNGNYYSKPRTNYGYENNEIVYASRADAEAVFFRMAEILNMYPVVRVADYLELSGRDSNYTDNNYGWTTLDNVQIRRSRDGGYYLDLPRPMAID